MRGAVFAIAVAAALALPAVAQDTTIDARISASDSDREDSATPEAPRDPVPRDTVAPAQADTVEGEAISVEIPSAPPAQAPSDPQTPPSTDQRSEETTIDLTAQEVPLSAILGLAVRREDGSEMGTVEDVIVSLRTGRIMSVVIGSGGFLGMGGTTERIPIDRIAIDALGEAVIVSEGKAEGG